MKSTLRGKLASITLVAMISLGVVAGSTFVTASAVTARLDAIRTHHVPKIELRPRLEREFDLLRRAYQDAVAAQDGDAIDDTRRRRDAIVAMVADARGALDPGAAEEFRLALDDYVELANDVSHRLVLGEIGEEVVESVESMQSQQTHVEALIVRLTMLREDELDRAFVSAIALQGDIVRVVAIATLTCFLVTTFLAWWLGRGMIRSATALTSGLARVGQGDFDSPIRATTHDEFADLAESANRMVNDLAANARDRERAKWMKDGASGLADELRGEWTPSEVGSRALAHLTRYVGATVGAIHLVVKDEVRLLASHALAERPDDPAGRVGEGLLGQAAVDRRTVFVTGLAAASLRIRSGIVDSGAATLAILPLVSDVTTIGVLELATVGSFDERTREFLDSVRGVIAVTLEVARSREATSELLAATQSLNERLAVQEEELRATNDELQVQQEELREANDELTQQAVELESQRRVVETKNDELERARTTLEQKASELATMSEYKSQFLANMSHELRTPLNSMLLLSGLLAENSGANLTERQVEFSRTIHEAGADLLVLINQVLDLAKIESGKTEIHREPVGLRSVVTQLDRMFQHVANEKGIRFAAILDPGLPDEIETDRHRLLQILTNLCGNAIKFTERGSVTLTVAPAPGATLRRHDLEPAPVLSFSVEDTGPGISSDDRERIFDPFEQVGGAASRRGGTGLGLAIARELAELLGGEMKLTSEVGVGSTFCLYLPLEAVVDARSQSLAPASPTAGDERVSASGRGEAPAILLVEDDPIFASVFSDLVVGQGLRCVVAGDGASAVRLARDLSPVGVVLDLGLPDVDGLSVLETLRSDPSTSGIPVHVISARDAAVRAKQLGAIGYLRKPATKEDLVRSIEALAPRRSGGVRRVLVVEDDVVVGDSLVAKLATEAIDARRVGSATEALDVLATETMHCVVVDLSLPDMDGLELLRALEKGVGGSQPPVVVYTGRALSKQEVRTLEQYSDAVVLKDGASLARVIDEVKLFTRDVRERVRAEPMPAPSTPDSKLAGRSLLLVDDDMRTVFALSAMLRSRGIEVLIADTGRAALASLDDHPSVDAVLMDIMMPEMDGYEAMRRIRDQPRFRALPIIALTAKAMLGDETACLEAGATAYLPKPVDPSRLFVVLSSCLRGTSP